MTLDYTTLVAATGLGSLLLAGLLALLARGHRGEPALWWLAAGALLGGLGFFAIAIDSRPRVPALRWGANLLFIADIGLLAVGLLRLYEARARLGALVGLPVAAMGLGEIAIGLAGGGFLARLWLFALLTVGLSLTVSWILLTPRLDQRRYERWPGPRYAVAAAFALHAAMHAFRPIWITLLPVTGLGAVLSPGEANFLALGETLFLTLVLAGAFPALHGQKMAASLAELAHYDSLTQLPNRRAFHSIFARTQAEARGRFALALLDMDNFKQLNDRYGHSVGDRVLASVARQLHSELGPRDSLLRLGGDEFLLILDLTERASAQASVARLLAGVAPLPGPGTAIMPKLSAGLATAPDEGNDVDSLYEIADRRLYAAKALENGSVVADDSAPHAARALG